MNWPSIATMLISFLGTLSGAGPWGIGAMILGAGGVIGAIAYLIAGWNKNVDSGDIQRSGADAGNTAVELKNQADENRQYEQDQRNKISKQGPPKGN